jgi:hypothetical protein
MNLRHAAALALVGWYLMVPPMDVTTHKMNPDAPLHEWNTFDSYDHAAQCRSGRAEILAWWTDHKSSDERARTATLEALKYSQCIATEDPRLKGN